jgi:hypothetical protein
MLESTSKQSFHSRYKQLNVWNRKIENLAKNYQSGLLMQKHRSLEYLDTSED